MCCSLQQLIIIQIKALKIAFISTDKTHSSLKLEVCVEASIKASSVRKAHIPTVCPEPNLTMHYEAKSIPTPKTFFVLLYRVSFTGCVPLYATAYNEILDAS